VVRPLAARGGIAVLVACAAGALAGPVSAATPPGLLDPPSAPIAGATNIRSLAVSADHRIVVAGISRQGVDGGHTFLQALNADLSPDTAFGGDGEVQFDPDIREPSAMVVEPDGQTLLVRSGTSPTLYRLNPDGSRDESFGSGGSVDIHFDGDWVYHPSLALYPDGRILVAGRSFTGDTRPPSHVHLHRYLPDGSPDPGFGTNGHVEQLAYDRGLEVAVALQPDGGIVLVGPSFGPGSGITRFTESGEQDLSFGRGGLSGVELGRQAWEAKVHPSAPLVLADGRIRIPITFGDFESVTRIGVVGLTANGRADRDYGRQGLALGPRIPFPEGGEEASAAVRDARGYLLIAGSVSHGDDLSGDDATVVRRFRPNGALDRSFGRRGVLRVEPPRNGQPLEQLLAMLDADTAVLAVESGIGKYNQWNGGKIRTFSAGYDREDPAVSLRSGCRWMRIRIRDTSPLDRLVVRINRRVVRHTTRKRLRIRVHPRQRVSVTAVDAAGNPARVRTTVPPC